MVLTSNRCYLMVVKEDHIHVFVLTAKHVPRGCIFHAALSISDSGEGREIEIDVGHRTGRGRRDRNGLYDTLCVAAPFSYLIACYIILSRVPVVAL